MLPDGGSSDQPLVIEEVLLTPLGALAVLRGPRREHEKGADGTTRVSPAPAGWGGGISRGLAALSGPSISLTHQDRCRCARPLAAL